MYITQLSSSILATYLQLILNFIIAFTYFALPLLLIFTLLKRLTIIFNRLKKLSYTLSTYWRHRLLFLNCIARFVTALKLVVESIALNKGPSENKRTRWVNLWRYFQFGLTFKKMQGCNHRGNRGDCGCALILSQPRGADSVHHCHREVGKGEINYLELLVPIFLG